MRNISNDDDENNEEDDGSKAESDLSSTTDDKNEDATEKKLDLDTASTVGDISLILNQILFNICSNDKATIPDNIGLLGHLKKMEQTGSTKEIIFYKKYATEAYFVPENLTDFIKAHQNK